jgi:hypothetical protein
MSDCVDSMRRIFEEKHTSFITIAQRISISTQDIFLIVRQNWKRAVIPSTNVQTSN